MEPMSKAFKLSGEMDTRTHGVDWISNLPPDLIGYILSLLPTTKEAVATSVLSTKWKWSWTFVTRLKFVECLSVDEHGEDQIESLKASFICFVFRVLFHLKPTLLNYLGFSCRQQYYAAHVRVWISAVLPLGIKELDLSIPLRDSDKHVLPFDLFSCKSLVKLKLANWGFTTHVPPIVCLPSLEVLTLAGVEFYDDDSFRRFLIGCPVLKVFEYTRYENTPVLPLDLFTCKKLAKLLLDRGFVMNPPTLVSLPSLESLHLTNAKFPDSESFRRFLLGCPSLRELNLTINDDDDVDATVLHIDAPMLSDLKLYLVPENDDGEDVVLSKLVLDTPSLKYLEVFGIAAESLEVTDLSHIVEADIGFVQLDTPYQVASNLIMAMPKVQTLCLSYESIEVISEHGCKLPKFEKMTTLKLGAIIDAGWALLTDLLENSPVLETLVFENGFGAPPSEWYTHQEVPHCLTHHLKLIEVNNFEGDIEDIEGHEMIKFFIENSGDFGENLTMKYSCDNGCKTRIIVKEF